MPNCNIFISYCAKEFAEAEMVRSVLEKNGFSCWMAPNSIPVGSSYAKEIPQAIRNCKAFLLLLSSKAQSSIWIPRELDLAVNEKKVIIPFMLEDCELLDEFNFYLIGSQRYAAYEKKAEALESLVHRLRAIVGTPELQSAPEAAAEPEPMPEPMPEPIPEPLPEPMPEPEPVAEPEPMPEPVPLPAKEPTAPAEAQYPYASVAEAIRAFLREDPECANDALNLFAEKKIPKLLAAFPIPESETVLLAHDDTLRGNGKNGFALTEQGIYVKQLFDKKPSFLSWKVFRECERLEYPEDNKSVLHAVFSSYSLPVAYISGSSGRKVILSIFTRLVDAVHAIPASLFK